MSICLVHGSALKKLRGLQPATYDAVITDPPYASGGMSTVARRAAPSVKYTNENSGGYDEFAGEHFDQRSWSRFMTDVLESAREACKPGAVCLVFADWRQYPALSDAIQLAGWTWRGTVVWDKKNSRPQKGRFRQQTEYILWGSNGKLPVDRPVPSLPGIYSEGNVRPMDRLHLTQKPTALMRALVKTCVPGGHILDPFAGSGSTLEAAALEGYGATGIEINADIAHLAAKRLGISLADIGTGMDERQIFIRRMDADASMEGNTCEPAQ